MRVSEGESAAEQADLALDGDDHGQVPRVRERITRIFEVAKEIQRLVERELDPSRRLR